MPPHIEIKNREFGDETLGPYTDDQQCPCRQTHWAEFQDSHQFLFQGHDIGAWRDAECMGSEVQPGCQMSKPHAASKTIVVSVFRVPSLSRRSSARRGT